VTLEDYKDEEVEYVVLNLRRRRLSLDYVLSSKCVYTEVTYLVNFSEQSGGKVLVAALCVLSPIN